jgi:hypothetical protein
MTERYRIVDGFPQYLTPRQQAAVQKGYEMADEWRADQAAKRRPNGRVSSPSPVRPDTGLTERGPAFPGVPHLEALTVEVKPARQLIRGLVGAGTVGTVAGLPESYKSWLALQITYAVAGTGGHVLGHDVLEQGAVAYWWQDDSDDEEFSRLQVYAHRHGLTGDLPIQWHVNEGLQLPRDVDVLRREIEQRSQILIVLDSLYNFTEPGVLLKDEVIADIFKAVKAEVCDQTGCAVMFVDHSAWPTESNRGIRAYGSVFKTAAVRWGIYLKATAGKVSYEAHGNNMPRTKRTPLMWDEDALLLRVIDVEKAKKAPTADIAKWVRGLDPPVAMPSQLRDQFDITDDTLRRRRDELAEHGVLYVDQGKQSHYTVAEGLLPRDDVDRGVSRGAAHPAGDPPRDPAMPITSRGASRGGEQGEIEDGGW